MPGETPHWPCPNHCWSWCRAVPRDAMTNHHPNCEFVDASLIEVWSVHPPGEQFGCITDSEKLAREMAAEDPHAPLEVVAVKMHREIYENLEEFGGF